MLAQPSLIAFGPVAKWPSSDRIHEISRRLRQDARLKPIIEEIDGLSALWRTLIHHAPALDAVPGEDRAKMLAELLRTGDAISDDIAKTNIMTMPMTVLTQIISYLDFLDGLVADNPHQLALALLKDGGGVQGFCAGLLNALGIASAHCEDEIIENAAISIRLAFCAGAFVDEDNLPHDENQSVLNLAVRWKASTTTEDFKEILAEFPDAYVAVTRDIRDVTITIPTALAGKVQETLQAHGISSIPAGFHGRYHTVDYQHAPSIIVESCDLQTSSYGRQEIVRSNSDAQILDNGNPVEAALRSILIDHADWYRTISTASAALKGSIENHYILAVGADAIPSSIAKTFTVINAGSAKSSSISSESIPRDLISGQGGFEQDGYPDRSIAVIGMSCKMPGADSVDEFWKLLTKGTSMLKKMPRDRFDPKDFTRSARELDFWGNFIEDIQSFDHKFFKKSAREAASMDPQQRLLLQAAYHALESSGYFASRSIDNDIGCYLGLCATDYDGNVGCHPPTAYSTTGTLRAFLSGKISHYFGWSGPSLTFDTACSSSAVAIHTACSALLAGECSQAVAGGVALFTTPYLYENLAAAHFLSPTGATKSFDASADGYCRGEGIGLVVLKRLSDALKDGDSILGVIAGSAINQNKNCVPITVPYSASQASLYEKVSKQAGIKPTDVTFVEAHGTGTPVGDPIEMESIRSTFGGSIRSSPLFVSSVKGNIGHLEGASGVAALIKALLQMQHRTACIQASFKTLNPRIPALEADKICIPTSNLPLPDGPLSACVNNYGAAGSNTALLLLEAPRISSSSAANMLLAPLSKFPFQISAASTNSLVEYCRRLLKYIDNDSFKAQSDSARLFASIAHGLSKRHNQTLTFATTFTSSNMSELKSSLTKITSVSEALKNRPSKLPVVLTFGGQVGQSVGLNKRLFDQYTLLRHHLDECDATLGSLGYPSLYPAIFQKENIEDVVTLQSSIFSLQYSSARAWLDSGLHVDGVIGHSLGQFAALCVSGVVSLKDGLKFVAGRASFMKEHWGSESGTMVAVEADKNTLERIQEAVMAEHSDATFEIACLNGQTSYVLVSDKLSIDYLQSELQKRGLKHKRLDVTHGFHSRFTDDLIPHLEDLASSLTFHNPDIHIETCTDAQTWSQPSGKLLAAHTRDPVYFGQAMERLESRLGACTFLEAGSTSSITSMARRAMQSYVAASHFVPVDLVSEFAADTLADTTASLWKFGHQVQFWGFHRLQRHDFDILHLPEYHFEKTKHWLHLIPPAPPAAAPAPSVATTQATPEPPAFLKLSKSGSGKHHFRSDPQSEELHQLAKGFDVVGVSKCWSSICVELTSRAIRILVGGDAPSIRYEDLRVQLPPQFPSNHPIELAMEDSAYGWTFYLSTSVGSAPSTEIARGSITIQTSDRLHDDKFSRYERLIDIDQIAAIVDNFDAVSVRGPMIPKILGLSAKYPGHLNNLKRVDCYKNKISAKVTAPQNIPEILKDCVAHPWLLDSFLQIAEVDANCIHDNVGGGSYSLSGIDHIEARRSGLLEFGNIRSAQQWDVLGFVSEQHECLAYDVFVFDNVTSKLEVILLGITYTQANNAASLANQQLPTSHSVEPRPPRIDAAPRIDTDKPGTKEQTSSEKKSKVKISKAPRTDPKRAIFDDVSRIVEGIADVPKDEIKGNLSFEDVGVDSLMMIEVIDEISKFFKKQLPIEDLEKLTDFDSLVNYLHGTGCQGSSCGAQDVEVDSDESDNAYDVSTAATSPISTPASTPPEELPMDGLAQKLSRIVAEHLEIEENLPLEANLGDNGLDSLLCIELANSLYKEFKVHVDMMQLDEKSTLEDLFRLTFGDQGGQTPALNPSLPSSTTEHNATVGDSRPESSVSDTAPRDLKKAHQAFEDMRNNMADYCQKTGFGDFWDAVYPDQAKLVEAYILEAFAALGGDVNKLSTGDNLPSIDALPKHKNLIKRMKKILVDGGILETADDETYGRSKQPVDRTSAAVLFERMLKKYPKHAAETRLLDVSGSRMVESLTGKQDPLALLFANKTNRGIMAEVYENAPMCQATTRFLSDFLAKALSVSNGGQPFRILEVGAGTGGTARYLINALLNRGVKFEYTFTDLSSSLVAQAKRLFRDQTNMHFMTLDCNKVPAELVGRFDVVVATNVIHATKDATTSVSNVEKLLRKDGLFCLVEFTTPLYWFDLVYGLLEGWWYFNDGRKHALADEAFWDRCLRTSGFDHVAWSGGNTRESQTMRLIVGFKGASDGQSSKEPAGEIFKRAGIWTETFTWKKAGSLELQADVYYPKIADEPGKKRPIALMIHGGGHLLFSRQDIPMKHVRTLLARGYLPVSVDYRLCPEMSLFEGPVTDCCDALKWAREVMPTMKYSGPSVTVDSQRLLALGWSSGGQLAMTLGHTAKTRGIKPPDVILPFYSPSDLEADFWSKPIFPAAAEEPPAEIWGELDSVLPSPILSYTPLNPQKRPCLSLTLKDDRARLILHMNWTGQSVNVLIRGLPSKSRLDPSDTTDWKHLPPPPVEEVRKCSPYYHILQGDYTTPTFMVHGNCDDWIPYQMTEKTVQALREKGVPTGILIPDQCGHAFDLFPQEDKLGVGWECIEKAYDFAEEQLAKIEG
ncbi:hypothetical protein K461DRAFT_225874 [Myriangium duriaei CBS 260.36]|uniref:S-adenosyl-L-methionine-dependent N-methyltransferase n=1 Tax=Myriangium duriaei CBS 260.36 TaxID=1168546 RepID=A0A9P4J264_9PEZI|nr:hypothetical protein K461DRAFT_225874 [Myriangium duriaei CBS 260.36]